MVNQIDVVELFPGHATPVQVPDAVGRQIGHLDNQLIAAGLEQADHVDAKRVGNHDTCWLAVHVHSGTFAHVAQIDGPAILIGAGQIHGGDVSCRPGKSLGLVVAQLRPAFQLFGGQVRGQDRAAFDKLDVPRPRDPVGHS